jgi:CPA1 family monovalent cation:H+ antiporter
MDFIVNNTIALLVAAVAVALVARRLALPYTVGLVIAGIGLALTRLNTGLVLTHDLIFTVILPPLLFEAAINIHWRELRRDAVPVLMLALVGTMISAAVVTASMMYFLAWPIMPAILFGVLIAATDPVAVIAMFKDNGIGGRLRLLVECESLFNDGVAAVLFTLVRGSVEGGHVGRSISTEVSVTLLSTVVGGIIVGLASSGAAILAAGRTKDHLVESTLTTVAAYGSFLLAEYFHMSGVLATVTAGLVMGNLAVLPEGGPSNVALEGRAFVLDLWEFIAFIANSLVFLLIGLTVGRVSVPVFGLLNMALIIGFVLLGRALTVYPLCLVFFGSKWRIPLQYQHVLWWGGLRGALGLALALSLPETLEMHDEILIATFGVVAFSVVVQGLTMPWLLKMKSEQGAARTVQVD